MRSVAIILAFIVALTSFACSGDSVTTPPPPLPVSSVTVAGTVWLHDTGGVKPYTNVQMHAFVRDRGTFRTAHRSHQLRPGRPLQFYGPDRRFGPRVRPFRSLPISRVSPQLQQLATPTSTFTPSLIQPSSVPICPASCSTTLRRCRGRSSKRQRSDDSLCRTCVCSWTCSAVLAMAARRRSPIPMDGTSCAAWVVSQRRAVIRVHVRLRVQKRLLDSPMSGRFN